MLKFVYRLFIIYCICLTEFLGLLQGQIFDLKAIQAQITSIVQTYTFARCTSITGFSTNILIKWSTLTHGKLRRTPHELVITFPGN